MDQPTNDFDEHEHGEDASSAAYDAEQEEMICCDQCSQEKPEDGSRSNEEVTVCADCCAKNDDEFWGRRT